MPRTVPDDRFADLIEAATSVFLEQGYRRTQIADVAGAMGVAKGTIYLYAESKEALFEAALRYADEPAPAVSELELIEPSLYFSYDTDSARRFADALDAMYEQQL